MNTQDCVTQDAQDIAFFEASLCDHITVPTISLRKSTCLTTRQRLKTKVFTMSTGTALLHILKEKGFGEYALKCDHEV